MTEQTIAEPISKFGTRVVVDFPDRHWCQGNPYPETHEDVVAHFHAHVVYRDGKFLVIRSLGLDETGWTTVRERAEKLFPFLNYLSARFADEVEQLNKP